MLYADTIAAIATPPGEGGVGIVRLSGPDAPGILRRVFRPARGGDDYRPQCMRYGRVVDEDGRTVDEALAVYFKSPHSFTGEDVVELHCHGGPLPLQSVLRLVLGAGARAAEPGEFTMRAFVNGRLDLAQAEATLDIIRAKTETGLRLAIDQLGGWLSREVREIRELLLHPLAYLTALVDFPEDDVPVEDLMPPLHEAHARLARLVRSAEQGMIVRQGARAVLVGRPNAGKSSLLNALLRRERAIVTPIPGTTRDTIEEQANLGGVPVVLIDTAGIAETQDMVERIGIERSRAALALADLALLLVDRSTPLSAEDLQIAGLTHGKPTILVRTKADLAPQLDDRPLREAHPSLKAMVETSTLSGAGLDELAVTVARTLLGGAPISDAHLVTNPRHRDALFRVLEGVSATIDGLASLPADLLAIELTDALHALGEISGETIADDLLHAIFSRFCIGK
ncbi:MAG: tRNA modification GTPase MnmE [Herpetosiphonaceae bacterium]|nr:MAG: tRNA modification GTPase MnmE [Herpetosiphonaceae bacterium]